MAVFKQWVMMMRMVVLRFLLQSLFFWIALVLMLTFMIRIFAPGNADTASLFQMLLPIQPYLERFSGFLAWPVQWVLQWLQPYWPQAMKPWFPMASASACVEWLAQQVLHWPGLEQTRLGWDLKTMDYDLVFPGVMDWRLLLAIALWGQVESVLMRQVNGWEVRRMRHKWNVSL